MLRSKVGPEGNHIEKPYSQDDDGREKDRATTQSVHGPTVLNSHPAVNGARYRWTAFSARDKLSSSIPSRVETG
jgi:hypothetical protein